MTTFKELQAQRRNRQLRWGVEIIKTGLQLKSMSVTNVLEYNQASPLRQEILIAMAEYLEDSHKEDTV